MNISNVSTFFHRLSFTLTNLVTLAFLSLGLFYLFSGTAFAATCTFSSVGNNNWNTSANWSCGAVPTVADDVIVPAATTTIVDVDFTINTLDVGLEALVRVATSTELVVNASTTNAGVLRAGAGGIVLGALGNATTTNQMTITMNEGFVTSSSFLVNNGAISGGTGVFAVSGSWVNASGSYFEAQTGTVKVFGNSAAFLNKLPSATYYNLESAGSCASYPTLGGEVSVSNTFRVYAGTCLGTNFYPLRLMGNTYTSGTLYIQGSSVTTTGPVFHGGTFTFVYSGSKLVLSNTVSSTGTLIANGVGTVVYGGNVAQNIIPGVYHVLDLQSSGLSSLTASSTVSSTLSIANGASLAIGSHTFTSLGSFSNNGTVTVSGGKIVHTAEFIAFTSSTGVTSTNYGYTDTVYVTVRDANRNLLANTIESVTATVSVNGGADSLIVTLQETGANTGIFRNTSGIPLAFAAVNAGDSILQSSSNSGNIIGEYLDVQDASDAASTTLSYSLSVPPSSSSGGGGGGGLSSGNGGAILSLPIPVITVSTSVDLTSNPVSNPVIPTVFIDPRFTEELLTRFSLVKNEAEVLRVIHLVRADARAFSVSLDDVQARSIAQFIVYGHSLKTIKLGQGERRALIRDYMDTQRTSMIAWDDVERLVSGEIPLKRNLEQERRNVSTVLSIFRRVFNVQTPNFQDATHNLAWNTLQYRIRFPRDLQREAGGIAAFKQLFKRAPLSPQDWSTVRVLGYVR